ncbi:hypothetical protein IKF40_01705 [Candidatus Saccharibacteria bacterium]|nr:hypothetical protein [Candidatus Saccharibacteria bacterium]
MAKKLKLILAALAVAFSAGLALIHPVSAAEDNRLPINLQVSPTKTKISLTPGASYVGSFKVMNIGYLPFDYQVYATPFSVASESYAPNYEDTVSYSHMAEWVSFDKKTEKGTIQPGDTVEVSYTVNVPKDAPAGGQYAALMAETSSGNAEDANIKTIHRVGMILYSAVPGETRECAEIEKNIVNSFYFNPPITVSSLVKNCGNVEQTAYYTAKIYPLFSNEAVFSNEENPIQLDIYPETSRFNSIPWDGAPSIGIFKVTQIVRIGDQESEVTKYVLVCPLWILFVIIALIFFIIFWLVSRARDRKKEKRTSASKSSAETKSDKEEK